MTVLLPTGSLLTISTTFPIFSKGWKIKLYTSLLINKHKADVVIIIKKKIKILKN